MHTRTIGDNDFVDARVVSAGPCQLIAVVGYNSGADRWVHIHELATVAACADEKPRFCVPADSGRAFAFNLAGAEISMDAVTVTFSSTEEATTATELENASIQGIIKA
jgi:hypothetical protein